MKLAIVKKIFLLLWNNYLFDLALAQAKKTNTKLDEKAIQAFNQFLKSI